MNIYQKAVKVRKICENSKGCDNCIYLNKCRESSLWFSPIYEDLKVVAKTIEEEKWKVN